VASVIYDEKAQRMAEEMVMAEMRHIAQRTAQECDCKDGMFSRLPASRRRFLLTAGSAAGVAGSTAAIAQKAPPGESIMTLPLTRQRS
jgi:sulfane dehydrogenase subunit SoxC